MTRLSSIEKELLKHALIMHQRKNPGCKLTEKRCIVKLSEDCIGKGKAAEFHGRMCKACRSVYNRERYLSRVASDPDKPRRSVGRPRKEA